MCFVYEEACRPQQAARCRYVADRVQRHNVADKQSSMRMKMRQVWAKTNLELSLLHDVELGSCEAGVTLLDQDLAGRHAPLIHVRSDPRPQPLLQLPEEQHLREAVLQDKHDNSLGTLRASATCSV